MWIINHLLCKPPSERLSTVLAVISYILSCTISAPFDFTSATSNSVQLTAHQLFVLKPLGMAVSKQQAAEANAWVHAVSTCPQFQRRPPAEIQQLVPQRRRLLRHRPRDH